VRSETPTECCSDYEMPTWTRPRSGPIAVGIRSTLVSRDHPHGRATSPGDQVLSIERGAADYIAKGTDRQCCSRVARCGCATHAFGRVLVRGTLAHRHGAHDATLDGASCTSRKTAHHAHILAAKPGEVVSRNELLERAWGRTTRDSSNSWSRRCTGAAGAHEPGWIETVRGIGYRLVTQA